MFPGVGTVVNVLTVLLGAFVGVLAGQRLTERTRDVVTDALGLTTILIAATSLVAIDDTTWHSAVGNSAPMLIVLGAMVIGGLVGHLFGIEDRIEAFGGWLQSRLGGGEGTARARFIEGYLTASLVFCVGPLTILGSLNDGLGNGADMLFLKAALDGFAAIAFAASFGWGVAASALSVLMIQGSITVVGTLLGGVLPDTELASISATGGLLLLGMGLRLLRLRPIPVGDFLPALVVAPVLTWAIAAVR
ncbi:MAG: DUF554 domain-containing protein [Nocardioidaceae bacterium]